MDAVLKIIPRKELCSLGLNTISRIIGRESKTVKNYAIQCEKTFEIKPIEKVKIGESRTAGSGCKHCKKCQKSA